MKIIVAVIVYNRFENIQRWVQCWKLCDQQDAQLIIIHNHDNPGVSKQYKDYCNQHGVHYVRRYNIGFDIGAFQDVCRGRLKGFPNQWDIILWSTDDMIPMRSDFVSAYVNKLQGNAGIVCTEMSPETGKHIRTSGFCIRQSTAARLVFPSARILSKQECYLFEHRGKSMTLFRQILAMKLDVVRVDENLNTTPLWDTGHRHFLRRWHEHAMAFGGVPETTKKKVTFICPVYNTYPEIISSMLCQTYSNWELVLIHDGPNFTGLQHLVTTISDSRIKYIETGSRAGNWGHALRRWALQEIAAGRLATGTEYIVITNADNHHVPVYCEWMVDAISKDSNLVAVYCEKVLHSYKAWDILNCKLERGFLDCAGVMVRADAACAVGWPELKSATPVFGDDDHSADWFYFQGIMNRYGAGNFGKTRGCLLVHN